MQSLEMSLLLQLCLIVRGHACAAWKVRAWGRRCLVCLSAKWRRRVSVTLQRFTAGTFINEVLKRPCIERAFISVFHLSVSCNQSRVPSVGERLRSSDGAALGGKIFICWLLLPYEMHGNSFWFTAGSCLLPLIGSNPDVVLRREQFRFNYNKFWLDVVGQFKVGCKIANSVLSKTEEFMALKDLWYELRELREESLHSHFPVPRLILLFLPVCTLLANLSTKTRWTQHQSSG